MNEKTFIITDEAGNEIEYEIVLTFHSPDTDNKYVVYKLPTEEEEVMAAVYTETEDGLGEIMEIETEEEFQMIQDVLDAFLDEEEEE